jgi:hypothetical protein
MSPRWGSTPRLTDWLTVSRNMTLILTRNKGTWPSRLGESRIWDSKIWSRVPRDSDPGMTALARTTSNCKRQTRSIVRESAPHQQTRNCLTVRKSGREPQMGTWHQDRLADRPSIVTQLWLWLWQFRSRRRVSWGFTCEVLTSGIICLAKIREEMTEEL